MRIYVPQQVEAVTAIFDVWANVPLYQRGRVEVRRIDILIAVTWIFCTVYYGGTGGWTGALTGFLAYAMVLMTALWVLRRPEQPE